MDENAPQKNILSYCPKCRLNTDHCSTEMDAGSIVKVRCGACGNCHKFKVPVSPPKIRKRPKKESGAAAAIIWEASLAIARGKERDYSMAARYRIGDIVNHHIFGKGIVVKTYPNKCEMLFRDKERLMASANESRRA